MSGPADERARSADDDAPGRTAKAAEAFEAMPLVLVAWDEPGHVFAAANADYRELVGRLDTDLTGMALREVIPELEGQQIVEFLDRVLTSGRAETGREWRLQLGVGPDGPKEKFVDFTVVPRRDRAGAVTGLFGFATDVTDRVRERQTVQRQAAEFEQRYRAARDVVTELQEMLLPTELPVLPTAKVAARYLVAAHDQAAGGDWFDALPLTGGTLALVVGDVVGHGVAASAAMGQLRAVIDELLVATGDLTETLARADRLAARTAAMRAATVCVALLDPDGGRVRYATCGHPPPLVLTPDGAARYLDRSGGRPLGAGAPPRLACAALNPDEVLLLYTDGLIERPGRTLTQGMELLARVAGDAAANRALPAGAPSSAAERVCQQAVELLTRTGYDDDVTALAVQYQPDPVQPLRWCRPADADAVPQARAALDGWLRRFEPRVEHEWELQLAVSELVSNTAEHAYRDRPRGSVQVDAVLCPDGVLQVRVTDDGTWREPGGAPRTPTRGRGLWLAEAMVDELEVAHPGGATVVTLRQRLHRPAVLGPAPTGHPDGPDRLRPFDIQLHEGTPRELSVTGPVDASTAGRLAEQADHASRGGIHPLILDLTDVDLLASAGVHVLFQLHRRLDSHDNPLTLIAAPGTPAHDVLTLVGLDTDRRGTDETAAGPR